MNEAYHTAQQLPLFVTGKVCKQCQIEKPLEDFYADIRGKHGCSARCKDCIRANSKEYHQEHYVPVRNKPKAVAGGKVCSRCLIEQPITEFHKRKDTGGYTSHCKTCISEAGQVRADREGRKIQPLPAALNGGKVCSQCRAEKPFSEFTKDNRNKSGYNIWCKECTQTHNRDSYAIPANRQRRLETGKRWYRNNKDAHRALNERWKAENPLLMSEYTKNWRKENSLKVIEYSRRRYAFKKRVTTGKVNYRSVLAKSNGICYICEKPILPHHKIDFDHVIPIVRGGPHSEENLAATHHVCNRRKGKKLPSEMTARQRRGV